MQEVFVASTYSRHLALIGFATVCIQGLLSNSPFEETLKTALLVGVMFFPLGWILAELARWLVEDQVRHERKQHWEQAAKSVAQQ